MNLRSFGLLRVACVTTLVALGLMVWSLLDPGPLSVIVAMSVAQVLGTAAFATFLIVAYADLRRANRALEGEPSSDGRSPTTTPRSKNPPVDRG